MGRGSQPIRNEGDTMIPSKLSKHGVMFSVFSIALFQAACAPCPETTCLNSHDDNQRYELAKVFEVSGRQGIATDGDNYFVSGSTSLYKYDKDGQLLLTNDQPFGDLAKAANHIGDIAVFGGEIFAGIEWFEDGAGHDIQVAVYDALSLTYVRSIDWLPQSGQVEVSAVTVDTEGGLLWMTDWVNGQYLYRYDLKTGEYRDKLHLRPVPQWQQGITYRNGRLYISADDGDAELNENDNLWQVKAEPTASSAFVTHEIEFVDFRRAGEIEGVAWDPTTGELLVLSNRGARIVLGMPSGFYPGYDREIHEVYVYRPVVKE